MLSDNQKLIALKDAAAYSFDLAYKVARAIIEGHFCTDEKCLICEVVNAANQDARNEGIKK